MSATAPRPSPHTLPDASAFVATVSPAGPEACPASTIEAAADTGVLVAGRERLLAGTGIAATLSLPHGLADIDALRRAREWLASVGCVHLSEVDGDGGGTGAGHGVTGPIALGAFPFDREGPAALFVPSVTWCKDTTGRVWRVDVRPRGEAAVQVEPDGAADGWPGGASADSSGPLQVEQVPRPDAYAAAVAHAVADVRAQKLRKVVLGRMVELRLPEPVLPSAVLRTLWASEGVFSPFSVPIPGGRLVGASPELVIGRSGRAIVSHAFAGTVPLSASDGDADAEWLAGSAKDLVEHRLLVEEIFAALEPRCSSLTMPAQPTVVRLRSDARLGTLIRGTLASPSDDTALALLACLHPTAAVGGVPRGAAVERIASLERAPRGYWAGAVGWLDGAGDGEWVLGIRSVELDGTRARVRAGAGIVADSDPEGELAETTVKLRPVLEALWPGASSLL